MDTRFFTRETFKGQKPQKNISSSSRKWDDLGNSSKSSSNPNLGLTTNYSQIFSVKHRARVSNPRFSNLQICSKLTMTDKRNSQPNIYQICPIKIRAYPNLSTSRIPILRYAEKIIRACPNSKQWLSVCFLPCPDDFSLYPKILFAFEPTRNADLVCPDFLGQSWPFSSCYGSG